MIEQRYEFFIDNAKYPCKFEKTTYAKNINPLYLPSDRKDQNIERLMVCIEEYKISSHDDFLKNFFAEHNFKQNLYIKIYRDIPSLTISTFSLKDISELPDDTVLFPQNKKLTIDYYEEIKNSPHIIQVLDKEYFQDNLNEYINFGDNFIFSKQLIDYTKELPDSPLTDLRYRIYINDRLLIERFFPGDLPFTSILTEECHLNVSEPMEISLLSSHNLIFTKVVSNNKVLYPNSTEFILEP